MSLIQTVLKPFRRASMAMTEWELDTSQTHLKKAINGEKWSILTAHAGMTFDCSDPKEQEKWVKYFQDKIAKAQKRLEKQRKAFPQ